MAKIIKISSGNVTIVKDDGEFVSVMEHTLTFKPKVNDIVEVYENGEETIVVEVKKESFNPFNTVNETIIISGKKAVNRWIYFMLAILFGGFGFHKFYAGKVFQGIMFLLFFWTGIPSILGFISAIAALMATEVKEGSNLILV